MSDETSTPMPDAALRHEPRCGPSRAVFGCKACMAGVPLVAVPRAVAVPHAYVKLVQAAVAVIQDARDQGRDDCMDDLVDEQHIEGLRNAIAALDAIAEAEEAADGSDSTSSRPMPSEEDAMPEEANGSLDATEVATAIVFYRGHRFKERYSYAGHIADELRRFYAAGQAADGSGATLYYACRAGLPGCTNMAASSGPCASCVTVLAAVTGQAYGRLALAARCIDRHREAVHRRRAGCASRRRCVAENGNGVHTSRQGDPVKQPKRRIKSRGHCPWCSADIRLTRYGRPFHQHTRGAACRAARAAAEAANTCMCGHVKGEHADDRYECSAFVEDADEPCLCILFEAAPVSGAAPPSIRPGEPSR